VRIVADDASNDLYTYVSRRSESSIHGTLDYVIPFALGDKQWPHSSEATLVRILLKKLG
jgi:hypothetical protein